MIDLAADHENQHDCENSQRGETPDAKAAGDTQSRRDPNRSRSRNVKDALTTAQDYPGAQETDASNYALNNAAHSIAIRASNPKIGGRHDEQRRAQCHQRMGATSAFRKDRG
jgi:hypothetical protein